MDTTDSRAGASADAAAVSPAVAGDARLLAAVLRPGMPAEAAERIAGDLLSRYGSLRAALDATAAGLAETPGLGASRIAALRALADIARRYFATSLPRGAAIRSPADTEDYLAARLRHLPYELFGCLFLDNRHRVICFDELFRGTIDGTSVYPREVVRRALTVNAAAVIAAHNHPSGVAEPSDADERITRRLKAALELVDIRLLDHLVIGDARAVSLAGRGLL